MTKNTGIGGLLMWLRLLLVTLCLVAALQSSPALTPGGYDGVERAMPHDPTFVAAPPRFLMMKTTWGDLKAMPTGGVVPAIAAPPGPADARSVTWMTTADGRPPGPIPRTRTARAPPHHLATELT